MKVLALVALALAFVSLVLLSAASIGVPWDRETWDGNTKFETRRRAQQRVALSLGTVAGGLSIVLQSVVVLFGP